MNKNIKLFFPFVMKYYDYLLNFEYGKKYIYINFHIRFIVPYYINKNIRVYYEKEVVNQRFDNERRAAVSICNKNEPKAG